MQKIKVAFFFPDKKLGGGPFWLMRLASKLSQDKNYEVYYIDYSDGFSHQIQVDQSKIHFIDFTDHSRKMLIDEPCFLFAPIYYLHNMPKVHPDSKVLFFNWHNLCLPVLKDNMQFSDKRLNEFLELVYENQAEVFCDGAHYITHNEISKLSFPAHFVPIIMDNKKADIRTLIKPDKINVAILGRLVLDKIQSINNLIYNFEKLDLKKQVYIHIIGDGVDKDKIVKPKNKNIHLRYCGALRGKDLDSYLTSQVDILFAMGTSVMEGAALGLPSVIVSNSIEFYSDDAFVWFYDTKDYCLGWDPKQVQNFSYKQYTLNQILTAVYNDNRKEEIGKKCLDFIHQNFSSEFSVNQLKKYLSETTLKFASVHQFYQDQCVINSNKKFKYTHYWKIFGLIPVLKVDHQKLDSWKFSLFGILPMLKIKSKQKFIDILLFNVIPIIRIKKK